MQAHPPAVMDHMDPPFIRVNAYFRLHVRAASTVAIVIVIVIVEVIVMTWGIVGYWLASVCTIRIYM